MSKKKAIPAIAYLRTSSASNVGEDKDSDKRQLDAITAFGIPNGYELVETFYDAAVSGADPIHERPGFGAMLDMIAGNGVKTIIVENASRFARDLGVQIAGHDMLKDLGVDLIAVDSPQAFVDDSPTATMVRQILGAVSQFEKASLVAKLKVARDRKKARTGKCEGRKSWMEMDPEMVRQARRLARRSPKTGRKRSLRVISAEMAALGYVNGAGKPFHAAQVRRIVSPPS